MSDLITTGEGARLIAASHSLGESLIVINQRPRNIIAEILMRAMAQRKDIMRKPARVGPGRRQTVGLAGFRSGVTYRANGARECARRVRQIAAGQMKAENGHARVIYFDEADEIPAGIDGALKGLKPGYLIGDKPLPPNPIPKLCILAGRYDQAQWFARKNGLAPKTWWYPVSPEQLRGVRDFEFVRVGTWHTRPDCEQIERMLLMANATEAAIR